MQKKAEKQACTQHRYVVRQDQLPISCPPQDMRVWDAHPRVYLPITETGRAVCPYCEAEFILESAEKL